MDKLSSRLETTIKSHELKRKSDEADDDDGSEQSSSNEEASSSKPKKKRDATYAKSAASAPFFSSNTSASLENDQSTCAPNEHDDNTIELINHKKSASIEKDKQAQNPLPLILANTNSASPLASTKLTKLKLDSLPLSDDVESAVSFVRESSFLNNEVSAAPRSNAITLSNASPNNNTGIINYASGLRFIFDDVP